MLKLLQSFTTKQKTGNIYQVRDAECETIAKTYCDHSNISKEDCKSHYEKFCFKKNHNENVNSFFIKLNTQLKTSNLCFVSGSYVFEGTDVFKYLIESKHKKGVRIGQKVFGKKFISPASHNLHINGNLFRDHKADLSNSVLVEKNTIAKNPNKEYYSKLLKDHIGFQYEIDLGKNSIPYPCDNDCNTFETEYLMKNTNDIQSFVNYNNTKLKCSYNKEVKKCILFYVFAVNAQETTKYYTFVKLETMPTINPVDSAKHLKHAYDHYFTEHGANRKNLYPQRREDLLQYNNKLYKLSEVIRNKNDKFNLIKNTDSSLMDAYIHEKNRLKYEKI